MKYVAIPPRPKSQWDIWDRPATVQTTITVLESDDDPINTGLLDATGTPLYRLKDKGKMGYL